MTCIYEKAVSSLLHKFQQHGFSIMSVDDGEERTRISDDISQLAAKKQAVEIVCSVDQSTVRVKDSITKQYAALFIVLGNDKNEILCDYLAPEDLMPRIDDIEAEFYSQWENK